MSTLVSRVRFTVDDYHRMAETGILAPDQRVELLDGEVIEMTPIGARHLFRVAEFTKWLIKHLDDRYLPISQSPILLDNASEPEPDIAVVDGQAMGAQDRIPVARDVLLLIEFAETSLQKDMQVKLPLYAKAGVVEVWIADLTSRTLHIHRNPTDGKYAKRLTITGDQSITPANFPDLTVTITQVFGK